MSHEILETTLVFPSCQGNIGTEVGKQETARGWLRRDQVAAAGWERSGESLG